jgi:endonuclease-8
MPEGPSIVILREELLPFKNKIVQRAVGTSQIDFNRLGGLKVTAVRSWGKHLLLCFRGFFLRIHLLMFGSCWINKRKEAKPRLSIIFSKGEVNFYSCSVRLIEGKPADFYDWSVDVMSRKWDPRKATRALSQHSKESVCDTLLDQSLFSGAGNIIKNEVLFRTRVNPIRKVASLKPGKRNEIVKDVRAYSLLFYRWRKKFQLKKNLQIYKKSVCPRCAGPVTRVYAGKSKRLTFFCAFCQL